MARVREVQQFQARVFSPTWASPWRLGALGLTGAGLLAGVLGLSGVLPDAYTWWLGLATFGMGLMALLPRRDRWQDAQIEVHEGFLRIRGAGAAVAQIKARTVQALSTASTRDGAVVAVANTTPDRMFRRPVLIKVDDLQQADLICDSLAVGNRGLGALRWSITNRRQRLQRKGAAVAVVLLSLLLLWGQSHTTDPGFPVLVGIGISLMMAVLGVNVSQSNFREILLNSTGVDLSNVGCGWGMVPYHVIEQVERTDEGMTLTLSPPHPKIHVPLGMSGDLTEEEIRHLVDQIRSASQRARGQGKRVRVADEVLDELRRGDETIAAWLQRLDGQASAMRAGAYRGEGHNLTELWQALDDHDAAPEVRVAAARVLLRVQPDEASLRVTELVGEQRDARARKALELALEDEAELEVLARRFERCGLWADRHAANVAAARQSSEQPDPGAQ